MGSQDQEISDVVVILSCATTQEVDSAVESLKELGLSVEEIDYENSVIEGNIVADRVKKLEKSPHVKHVRSVFSYTAEPPLANADAAEAEADEDEETFQ